MPRCGSSMTCASASRAWAASTTGASRSCGARPRAWPRSTRSATSAEPAAPGRRGFSWTIGRFMSAPDHLPAPLSILQEVFGYSAFRGAQADIVDCVTRGGDALVLMPTGGGKSLCYQIPAIARHRNGQGVAAGVSPLIALMHDQVGALEEA